MSSPIIFKDRIEAGQKLANILQEFKNTDAIVLAIPRGGIIVAKEISTTLNLPLDLIVTRKIGAPGDDEYAIGAVDIFGNVVWNEYEKEHIDPVWIEGKIASEKLEAVRRWETYRQGLGELSLKDRTVIIVDDGIATGLTMRAAVGYAKHEGAGKIIVAAPVGADDAVTIIKKVAEVRILEIPSYFSAVGEWYEDFPQISDQEVVVSLSRRT